jgi:hypothetical protein
MAWFWISLLVVHLIGHRVVARRYFARRHGVSLEKGEPGVLGAALVGFAWPVTMFLDSTRNPEPCNHHRHILEHARLMAEIEVIDELRQRRRLT